MSEYSEFPITFNLVVEKGTDISRYENKYFEARIGENAVASGDTMDELMSSLVAKEIRVNES